MEEAVEEIWRAGFEAGQHLSGCRCPFPSLSPQADTWEDGWTQGMLKREGLAYRDHPQVTASGPVSARRRLWLNWKLKYETFRQR